MKGLITFTTALSLISCALLFPSCQNNTVSNRDEILDNIHYFRDDNTGLCFATVNSTTYLSHQVVSITCVPCDSLKHLK